MSQRWSQAASKPASSEMFTGSTIYKLVSLTGLKKTLVQNVFGQKMISIVWFASFLLAIAYFALKFFVYVVMTMLKLVDKYDFERCNRFCENRVIQSDTQHFLLENTIWLEKVERNRTNCHCWNVPRLFPTSYTDTNRQKNRFQC